MSAAPAMVSIGDDGALNHPISHAIADVWLDRDLGWLDFNDRVLAEALDDRTPLLKRVKFLAIFTSNLDEFFMKRIAILRKDPRLGRFNSSAKSGLGCWGISSSRLNASSARSSSHLRNTESTLKTGMSWTMPNERKPTRTLIRKSRRP